MSTNCPDWPTNLPGVGMGLKELVLRFACGDLDLPNLDGGDLDVGGRFLVSRLRPGPGSFPMIPAIELGIRLDRFPPSVTRFGSVPTE